jgi:hypothetical protein
MRNVSILRPIQRPTQAERRARSRQALLESAAKGLSRYGYGNLVLEEVARDAGYTRGATRPKCSICRPGCLSATVAARMSKKTKRKIRSRRNRAIHGKRPNAGRR